MPIRVFVNVYTADRFGLFNCVSVVRNLPKSVLLRTKQYIFSSSYNETFGRQNQKYYMGHIRIPKRCQPLFIHYTDYRYVHIDVF